MRIRLPALAAAAAVLSLGLAVSPATAAPSAEPGIRHVSVSFKLAGASLAGVAALSPTNVWAVGADNGGLIAHWNGTRWSHTVLKAIDSINGIAAISPSNIWAAGSGAILHWNGHAWSLAKYPILFYSISASSASDVWAGGSYGANSAPDSQNVDAAVLHWTGKKWYVVPLQSPKGSTLSEVNSLAVIGPKSAWATAYVSLSGTEYVLVHWNGTAWRPISVPAPTGGRSLVHAGAVFAAPHGVAWAFGWATAGQPYPQIMRWNGKAWQSDSGPLGQQTDYSAACFEPNGKGWAVGDSGFDQTTTGVSRWTGNTWHAAPVKVTGIKESGGFGLTGCSALSDSYAWAVGSVNPGDGNFSTLTLHWNGKIWS